jgi:hypothetical protein
MQSGRLRLEGTVAIMTGAGSSGPGVGTGKAVSIRFPLSTRFHLT